MALGCSQDYLDHIKDLKDRLDEAILNMGGMQQPPSIHAPWTEEDQKLYDAEWQEIEDVAADIFISLTDKEPFGLKKIDVEYGPRKQGDYLLLVRADVPFGRLKWQVIYFANVRYKEWDQIKTLIPNILEVYQLPERNEA